MSPTRSRTSRRASGCSATRRSCPSTRGSGARSSISGRSRGDFRRRPGSAREGAPRADAAPGRRARGRPHAEPGRRTGPDEPRRADRRGAARARPDGHARLGDRGGRLLQHPGGARQGGPSRQARAVARRAVAHDGQPELHVLPQAWRPLPQRARAQGGRRQVRHRARDEPGDQAPVPRVLLGLIPDPSGTLAELQAGDTDASLFGLGPEHVQEVQKDARFQVVVGDATSDVILAMNNSRKPYADVRVRRAITHAINQQDVLQGAMFGLGRILGSNVDPLNPYYVDVSGLMPYDPARAKKLLAEAGYPNGFETVLKVAPQYYYTVRTGEIIANHLAKVGVKVRIEQIEWGQWIARVWREADYDLTIIGHAEAWDIENYAKPTYYFRYDSPEFQTLFKESEVTLDDKARRELYARMQKKLVEDAPVVWLYMHPRLVVAKKGVAGLWKDLPVPSADLAEVAWAK